MLTEKEIEKIKEKIKKGITPKIKINPDNCDSIISGWNTDIKPGKSYDVTSILENEEALEDNLEQVLKFYFQGYQNRRNYSDREIQFNVDRIKKNKIYDNLGPYVLFRTWSGAYVIPTNWIITFSKKVISKIYDFQGQELSVSDAIIYTTYYKLYFGNIEAILDTKWIRVKSFDGNTSLVDKSHERVLKLAPNIVDLALLSKLQGTKKVA